MPERIYKQPRHAGVVRGVDIWKISSRRFRLAGREFSSLAAVHEFANSGFGETERSGLERFLGILAHKEEEEK